MTERADQTPSLRHRGEYVLFRAVLLLVACLPWRAAQAAGAGLGALFLRLDRRHRQVVRDNLAASDLEVPADQHPVLALEVFRYFGSMALETLKMIGASREQLARRVRVLGLEYWDAAAAEGKGFIVLTGHYGNWEATALALSALGRPFAVIGRELDNPLLEARLKGLRSRWGNTVIPKRGAMRDTLKVFKRGGGVGFLLDQDALTNGILVRFLGRWASTFPAAGTLAVKYGVPIVPLFSWPEADGSITVQIQPPVRVDATGDMDWDVWQATQDMSRIIEAQIRRAPRHWFWMHQRWKTQPGTWRMPETGPDAYLARYEALHGGSAGGPSAPDLGR